MKHPSDPINISSYLVTYDLVTYDLVAYNLVRSYWIESIVLYSMRHVVSKIRPCNPVMHMSQFIDRMQPNRIMHIYWAWHWIIYPCCFPKQIFTALIVHLHPVSQLHSNTIELDSSKKFLTYLFHCQLSNHVKACSTSSKFVHNINCYSYDIHTFHQHSLHCPVYPYAISAEYMCCNINWYTSIIPY